MALVLVVDDEIGISDLLNDVLSDEGYRVLVAGNGRDALKRAEEERPDLVLSDFMMPIMDGAQLVEAMAGRPEFKDIPVILMSSAPEATIRERCTRYAIFVRKPFKVFDVIDLVNRLLNPAPTSNPT